ncbi:MAG: hypothetical protein J5848_06870 [Bacteroidales bacterium]|nr:hypothetical protein [Bacteroidales bacterium]
MSNKKSSSNLINLIGGDMLKSRVVLRQIPLLLLVLLFCLVLVAMRYRVESLSKEKNALEGQVEFLREQRIQMQKQYQESIRISRIDKELDTLGVGLIAGPPFELKINNNNK